MLSSTTASIGWRTDDTDYALHLKIARGVINIWRQVNPRLPLRDEKNVTNRVFFFDVSSKEKLWTVFRYFVWHHIVPVQVTFKNSHPHQGLYARLWYWGVILWVWQGEESTSTSRWKRVPERPTTEDNFTRVFSTRVNWQSSCEEWEKLRLVDLKARLKTQNLRCRKTQVKVPPMTHMKLHHLVRRTIWQRHHVSPWSWYGVELPLVLGQSWQRSHFGLEKLRPSEPRCEHWTFDDG